MSDLTNDANLEAPQFSHCHILHSEDSQWSQVSLLEILQPLQL